MELNRIGYSNFFNSDMINYIDKGWQPGRISRVERELYSIICETGELAARISGKFRNRAHQYSDFPTIGDWVALEIVENERTAIIHALLPRRSHFSRKAVLAGGPKYGSGRTEEQILAANVDSVFLVGALDGDFSPRRLERYLAIAWDSGAYPVIILNKADLCDDLDKVKAQCDQVAYGVPVHIISAREKKGFDCFDDCLGEGQTAVFLGSSGVGKSTIINVLLGEERLKTAEVRAYDQRGRHTTTRREMIILPGGGIVIDTPGLREIQAFSDEAGVERVFEDIESLAAQCKFNDCQHLHEPGCAVKKALEEGRLDAKRFENYLKLKREAEYMKRKSDRRARMIEQAKWKKISKEIRKYYDKKR